MDEKLSFNCTKDTSLKAQCVNLKKNKMLINSIFIIELWFFFFIWDWLEKTFPIHTQMYNITINILYITF